MRPGVDFQALLRALVEGGVEFVVVGGVGAVLQGAPLTTLDLDVVHARTTDNVDRLLETLGSLGARYRTHPHVAITTDILTGPGQVRLVTESGPLDLLGTIGDGLAYDDLVGDTTVLDVGGFEVQVLELGRLIEIKEKVGREKDRASLPILRRALEEQKRSES